MKILSYNVNGIRAAINKGFAEWLQQESPDILCLQETKAQPEQIDTILFEHLGYKTYAHSAVKKGYSGVAILTKDEPDIVQVGMGTEKYDCEGRVIRADYGDVTIIGVYVPSGTTGGSRQDFKMEFLEDFTYYLVELRKQRHKLIICGDYNICHKPIDINHPERHKKSSGFLPEEREWFDKFIELGFVDNYREFHPSNQDRIPYLIEPKYLYLSRRKLTSVRVCLCLVLLVHREKGPTTRIDILLLLGEVQCSV